MSTNRYARQRLTLTLMPDSDSHAVGFDPLLPGDIIRRVIVSGDMQSVPSGSTYITFSLIATNQPFPSVFAVPGQIGVDLLRDVSVPVRSFVPTPASAPTANDIWHHAEYPLWFVVDPSTMFLVASLRNDTGRGTSGWIVSLDIERTVEKSDAA